MGWGGEKGFRTGVVCETKGYDSGGLDLVGRWLGKLGTPLSKVFPVTRRATGRAPKPTSRSGT